MARTGEPHILLMRLSAMGDVAMTAPVIKALRETYPDLGITVLTRSQLIPFFRDIPGINFITPDFRGRHNGFFGLLRLRKEIRDSGVTHIADLHDVVRTKVLLKMLIPDRMVYAVIDKGRPEKKMLTRKFNKIRRNLKSTVQRYADVVSSLGFPVEITGKGTRNPVALPGNVSHFAGPKDGKWIGIAPFAKHKGKIYPTDLTDKLIKLLSETYSRVFVFGGGQYEQEFAGCMQERYANVKSVIGCLSLNEELDLISNLDIMISMDSATMHMASNIGVPVVSVWGATHPYAGFYGYGQDPEFAVQLDMECRPCSVYGNKPCLYGDYRCLTGIRPEAVASMVKEVLDRPGVNS